MIALSSIAQRLTSLTLSFPGSSLEKAQYLFAFSLAFASLFTLLYLFFLMPSFQSNLYYSYLLIPITSFSYSSAIY